MAKAQPKLILSPSRDIPFDKLILSQSNVRVVKAGVSLEDLADDIDRRTLLHGINVRPCLDSEGQETGFFEVPAGGRRFRALEILVKRKRFPKDGPVPCVVKAANDPVSAEEDSLAENTFREPLHPLDEFRGMKRLADKGEGEEAIAAHFRVTPAIVRQRLKLASVSPKLHEVYAEGAMTLDQLMAFSVNDDHARQEQVWELLTHAHSKSPGFIRQRMTENTVRAYDRRALFVGLDAYVAAGGSVMRDLFDEVFTRYIDSGFGLLGGEVAWIATTLIVIDVTLAALFWSWGEGDDIIARLIKKTLFVGVFAYIIGNWNALSKIVFNSFAGIGLKASGTGFTATELLQPGRVAQVGLDAGRPILDSISGLMGYVSFFENFIQIVVLLLAWILVLLAFFVLAIQLFITLIEFKLATLCGFVLIPFGLFGKTAFMAERVLGNVISSGVKVLVLAVIVGIGSTLFGEFTSAIGAATPTIEDAMTIVLAALSLLGLGIFGPGIANDIVSGGPQLGAGAAAGTAMAAGGALLGGAAAARMAAGAAIGGLGGLAAGGARTAGAAAGAYSLGAAGKSGAASVAGGLSGVGKAAAGGSASPLRKAAEAMKQNFQAGFNATSGATPAAAAAAPASSTVASGPPAWAANMQRRQAMTHAASLAAQTLRSGDGGGAGSSVDVSQKD